MFSGFVKAVDPLGSSYKFVDYFSAFNIQWLDPLSVVFAVLLSALEFLIGAALFLGVKNKLFAWLCLLFMSFFTPLTLYIAIANPVDDCGCFGDAIIMTNWQTFYKNIFLMIFASIVFIHRKNFRTFFRYKTEWGITFVFFLIPVAISIYGLRHLPVIDFLPWKVGQSMKIDENFEEKYYAIYKNKETGEHREYLSSEIPWQDSMFLANWEFIDTRIVSAPLPENYFLIADTAGNDQFKSFTQHDNYQFLLIFCYIEDANLKNIEKIKLLHKKASENNIGFIAITASTYERVAEFIENYEIEFEIYYSDEITLKTIIRSNPGLVLIKNGTILTKWHNNDIPEYEKINFKKLSDKHLKAK